MPRPGISEFLEWLINGRNDHHRHKAMVWSSAKPENVNVMVAKLFSPPQRSKLAAVWARDKLGLTQQQYLNKVQVYKQLEKIWTDPGVDACYPGYSYPMADQSGGEYWVEEGGWWDQTNTVLVDDTILKAASEPYNLLQISEFENRPDQKVDTTLHEVRKYIEELARYSDVSAYMKRYPFPKVPANDIGSAAPRGAR